MSQKITALMAIVLLGFVIVVGVSIKQVRNLADISARLASANVPLIHSASNIGFLIQSQYADAHRVVLSNTSESALSPLLNVISFNRAGNKDTGVS